MEEIGEQRSVARIKRLENSLLFVTLECTLFGEFFQFDASIRYFFLKKSIMKT